MDCIYQVNSRFCLYQVISKILFIPGHSKILFIPGHSKILFIPGGVLSLTPASVGRRALGRLIHTSRAIATAFAGLPS